MTKKEAMKEIMINYNTMISMKEDDEDGRRFCWQTMAMMHAIIKDSEEGEKDPWGR